MAPVAARSTSRPQHKPRRGSTLGPALILLLTVAVIVAGGVFVRNLLLSKVPVLAPPNEQCIANVAGVTASLDLEQSGYAAIIVAESIRRGLPSRAATIALATAMQESGVRNLDYGDRDSVGLFQQRPSQGWGTEKQLMDPWYASGKFYAALVKVKNWQTGDINDVAQQVQRSGVPDGYRKHVSAARTFASALTGQSPAAISCVDRGTGAASASTITSLLTKAFGSHVKVTASGRSVRLESASTVSLWAAAQLAMITTRESGVTGVSVGGQSWTGDGQAVATWKASAAPASGAVVTLR